MGGKGVMALIAVGCLLGGCGDDQIRIPPVAATPIATAPPVQTPPPAPSATTVATPEAAQSVTATPTVTPSPQPRAKKRKPVASPEPTPTEVPDALTLVVTSEAVTPPGFAVPEGEPFPLPVKSGDGRPHTLELVGERTLRLRVRRDRSHELATQKLPVGEYRLRVDGREIEGTIVVFAVPQS